MFVPVEINSALQEVENASYRQPGILRNFVEPLGNLLLSPTSTIRNLSHTLLARYWKHDPSAATGGSALRLMSKCLDSNQPEVVATALDRLPDLVLSAQGAYNVNYYYYYTTIISCVFSTGIFIMGLFFF